MVKVIVMKIKMIVMISDNGDNESDAGDDMMVMMMMMMMMTMTMIRRRRGRRYRMKNTNIDIVVCIYNSCGIHVLLSSYTCFAPVFIRRSCLISRMINFRSFAVHLKMTKAMTCQGK